MTQHYVANVCRLDGDLAMGQVVPTDESYERVDESRLVIDLFLTDEGDWKATGYYDPATGDRGRMPPCFVPDRNIISALEAAHEQAKTQRVGMSHSKFTLEAN